MVKTLSSVTDEYAKFLFTPSDALVSRRLLDDLTEPATSRFTEAYALANSCSPTPTRGRRRARVRQRGEVRAQNMGRRERQRHPKRGTEHWFRTTNLCPPNRCPHPAPPKVFWTKLFTRRHLSEASLSWKRR